VALSLSMKVPLWGGAYAAGENEARARGAAARARALDARNGLMAQVREHTARIRDAVRRVQVYDTTLIPQAQTAFESVVASYAAGRSSVSDLLLAERDLLALRSERYAAQADYATDLARLESVVGRPVSLEEHDTPPGVSNDR
jgi:outer membrane protein TolC